MRIKASRCAQPEWTPPSDTRPIRCTRSASENAARSTGLESNPPLVAASSIRVRSCITTAPAPRFMCPTSELPI